MTEQMAIDIVRKEKAYMDSHAGKAQSEAFDIAIKALEEISLYKQVELCLIPADVYKKQCEELEQYRALGTVEEILKEFNIQRDIIATQHQTLKEYRNLGTVEELRVARDKQVAMKPNKTIDSTWGIKREVHVCPVCDYYLLETHFIVGDEIKERKMVTFCDTCGQAIDWEEV